MKKQFLVIIALIFMLGAVSVDAQKTQRITFERGAREAVATGKLSNYKSRKVFVIRVRAGQTLSTEQLKSDDSTHYVTVAIKDPNGEYVGDSDASCNNRKEITPTAAGDYRIEVFECMKADEWCGKFRLKVRVD